MATVIMTSPSLDMNQYVDTMSRLIVRDPPPAKAYANAEHWFAAFQPPKPEEPPVIMLNATKLSQLLAENVDRKLYPRMFAMSPAGILIAYSTTDNIKELRDQASLVSMVWKDHETTPATKSSQQSSANPLETLTIEFEHCNIIVRAVQPKLLLVLVGAVPPGRRRDLKITPEQRNDPRYPSTTLPQSSDQQSESADPSSTEPVANAGPAPDSVDGPNPFAATEAPQQPLTERDKDIKLGILHIQRKKIDAMSRYIQKDFESSHFVLPDAA